MIVPFTMSNRKTLFARDFDKEVQLGYCKEGDILPIIREDFIDFNEFVVESFRYFIDEKFNKSHEQYNFLKELIYSEDKDNLIIALTIINGL